MTAVPEVLAAPGKERVSADVPDDVARRLRIWAAVLGKPVAHVVSNVICTAVPSDEALASQIQTGGAGDDRAKQ